MTVKGLEGELREMAERQQKEVSDLKMFHAEQIGKLKTRCASETEDLRRTLEKEKEDALVKERQLASSRYVFHVDLCGFQNHTYIINNYRLIGHFLKNSTKLNRV